MKGRDGARWAGVPLLTLFGTRRLDNQHLGSDQCQGWQPREARGGDRRDEISESKRKLTRCQAPSKSNRSTRSTHLRRCLAPTWRSECEGGNLPAAAVVAVAVCGGHVRSCTQDQRPYGHPLVTAGHRGHRPRVTSGSATGRWRVQISKSKRKLTRCLAPTCHTGWTGAKRPLRQRACRGRSPAPQRQPRRSETGGRPGRPHRGGSVHGGWRQRV